nr:recombinant luciferase [synthetic construct]
MRFPSIFTAVLFAASSALAAPVNTTTEDETAQIPAEAVIGYSDLEGDFDVAVLPFSNSTNNGLLFINTTIASIAAKEEGVSLEKREAQDCYESTWASNDYPSSCEALNGRCVDSACGSCDEVLFGDGLCENAGGASPKCCRQLDCPEIVRCRVSAAGYFQTFYGQRFNLQVPGTYLLSEDCVGGLWSLYVNLANIEGEKGAVLDSVKMVVGDVTVDIKQKVGAVTVNGGSVEIDSNPFSIGDVTIAIVHTPNFDVSVIEFLKLVTFDILQGRAFRLAPDFLYADRTCGLCGVMSDEPTDFIDNPDQLAIQDQMNQDIDGCPLSGNPSDVEYCVNKMQPYKDGCVNKNDVHFGTYLYACALAYCMGGDDRVEDVIFEYAEACVEPIGRATCVMNGHTYYDTFDKTSYQFQAPCKVLFAKDCTDDDWEVTITHKAVGEYTEVEKVTVRYFQTLIDLISETKKVFVNGTEVSVPYNYGDTSIYMYDNLITTAVLPGAVVVKYNFEQMLALHIRDPYEADSCGLCGIWDLDKSNEGPDTQYVDCEPTPNPPTCTADKEAEARELCQNMFPASLDDQCNICYKADRVERCMYEYCLGGLEGFCQHAGTVIDECFVRHGDDLQYPPQCKAAASFLEQKLISEEDLNSAVDHHHHHH